MNVILDDTAAEKRVSMQSLSIGQEFDPKKAARFDASVNRCLRVAVSLEPARSSCARAG
jgi:hypothetical protein